ncbi:unnamed protein product, partial [Polarella glacialis]
MRMDKWEGYRQHWVLVLDLGGSGAKGSVGYDFASRLLKIVMRCYPGRLYRVFVIDTSMIWNAFWNAACRVLEADTVNKVRFVRRTAHKDGTRSVPELVQQVGEENLEVEYGGSDPFEWDPQRHWLISGLVERPKPPPPPASEGDGDEDEDQEGRSRLRLKNGEGANGMDDGESSSALFQDAMSVGEAPVVTKDVVLADCHALFSSLCACVEADHEPRLARLHAELHSLLQDPNTFGGAA